MKKIFVTGFIKTTSPLHITAPSNARFDTTDGSKAYIGGVPCTSVQRIGVPTMFTPKAEEGVEQAASYSGLVNTPVIAGNNIAGRLRREISNVFLEALRDVNQTVGINTYSAIKCGAATGSPDGAPITYDEYTKATKHPFLGLLGGGPRMITREAKINNCIALCRESRDLLDQVRIPYKEIYDMAWESMLTLHNADIKSRDLTGLWGYRRIDDLKDLVGIALAEKCITDFRKVFDERQAQIIEEFKNGKDEGSSKTSVNTYQGLEFVLPGVTFPFVARLHKLNDAQAGLWIKGFERFAQDVSIGGWDRSGFGDFAFLDGRISVFEDGEMQSCEEFNPCSNIVDEDSFRGKAVAAWSEAAQNVKAADIDYLMRLPVDKKAAKAAKAEKTALAAA